jgi:hypothetical protein
MRRRTPEVNSDLDEDLCRELNRTGRASRFGYRDENAGRMKSRTAGSLK